MKDLIEKIMPDYAKVLNTYLTSVGTGQLWLRWMFSSNEYELAKAKRRIASNLKYSLSNTKEIVDRKRLFIGTQLLRQEYSMP